MSTDHIAKVKKFNLIMYHLIYHQVMLKQHLAAKLIAKTKAPFETWKVLRKENSEKNREKKWKERKIGRK